MKFTAAIRALKRLAFVYDSIANDHTKARKHTRARNCQRTAAELRSAATYLRK